MFWSYMLECADGTFYTGHTDNLQLRIAQHEQGAVIDCYTYDRSPVKLVYIASFPTRYEALQMERRIKGWSRAKKIALIKGDWNELSRLSRLKKASSAEE